MAEYIDREKAIEFIRLNYCKDCNSYNGVRCRACSFDDAMLGIEDVPTADVVEVKHGEWKPTKIPAHFGGVIYECSICGAKDGDHTKILGRYCWKCGAKMDGERKCDNG